MTAETLKMIHGMLPASNKAIIVRCTEFFLLAMLLYFGMLAAVSEIAHFVKCKKSGEKFDIITPLRFWTSIETTHLKNK